MRILVALILVVGCASGAEPLCDEFAGPGALAVCEPFSYVDADGVSHAWVSVCEDDYELRCAPGDPNSAGGPGAYAPVCEGEERATSPACPRGGSPHCVDVICDGSAVTP